MAYKVVVTSDAEQDLDRFLDYLVNEKKNKQAALNVLQQIYVTCAKREAAKINYEEGTQRW